MATTRWKNRIVAGDDSSIARGRRLQCAATAVSGVVLEAVTKKPLAGVFVMRCIRKGQVRASTATPGAPRRGG